MNESPAQRRARLIAQAQPAALTLAEKTFARMATDVYVKFEAGIPGINTIPKTDLEAGFLAGAEYVLRKLRIGIVVGE